MKFINQFDYSAPDITESTELIERNKIDDKYKWNIADIYLSDEDWEKDFRLIESKVDQYYAFKGTIKNSAHELLECLKFDEEIGIKFGHLYLYSMLSKDLDLADANYQGMYDRVTVLSSKLDAASSFIRPEILEISSATLSDFIESEKELEIYRHFLDNIIRAKNHTLSDEQEIIMANVTPALQVSYNAFTLLTNADFEFPIIKDESGNDIQISQGRYSAAMYSLDRDYRKRFYSNFYLPFIKNKNTLSALFNGNLKASLFNSQTRNYNSTREASLDKNNIPISVYDNLVNTVDNNLEPLHRWCSLKKKVLNVDELHSYDIYVTLFPSVKRSYSFEEGKELVLNSLKPFGDEYLKNIITAFDNRWLDVFETKGKRNGAYSSGTTFGMHPFVLLNWNNDLNDVFTLTHEMGHNMHSFNTANFQPYPYANYSIFIAEVASTINEALLLDYLIENSNSKEEKLYLIEKHIQNIVTTFYRQTLFAKFEHIIHEKTQIGEALTSDLLCNIYSKLHQEYWGDTMVPDEEETYTWSRVPHFYYNFYVYQYATSFAASEVLAHKIKNEGEPAVEKYLSFLKAGSSDYPINVLNKAGVDMNSPEPIFAVTQKMNNLLDELEKLI